MASASRRLRCRIAIACWPLADPLARYRAVKERLVEAHHQFWPSEEAMADGNPQLILERSEVGKSPGAVHAGHCRRQPDPGHGAEPCHRLPQGRRLDPAAPDAVRALGLIEDFIRHQTGS